MRPVRKADNLTLVMKSGNFNFLEPSGPLQACNGTALPLPYIYICVCVCVCVCMLVCLCMYIQTPLHVSVINRHLQVDSKIKLIHQIYIHIVKNK